VWRSASSGSSETYAVKSDGTLWGWGETRFCEETDSSYTPGLPQPMSPDTDWSRAWTGADTSCATKADGSLWCWERYWRTPNVPTRVGTATDWAAISPGNDSVCGLKQDGSLWCWGSNSWGQLGLGVPWSAEPLSIGQ
jgi:alpha-tubulin suppressor-like RCC1 family protein